MAFINCSRPPAPGLLGKADLNISWETVHSSSLYVAVGGLCVCAMCLFALCRYTFLFNAEKKPG